jgi:hypothetical protein
MNNILYKDTVLVVYPTGGYGSFLHWCLAYFSGELDIESDPFMANGSAHKFVGGLLKDCTDGDPTMSTDEYLNSDNVATFVRTHAIFDNDEQLIAHRSYIQQYQNCFKKIVLLTQDPKCHLLILHNSHTKTRILSYQALTNKIINKYKIIFGASDTIPPWQLREMISYYHDLHYCFVNDMYQPVINNCVINVPVRELVDNFELTITTLFDQLNIPMVRIEHLLAVKEKWLSLQKFTDIDRTCQRIVDCIIAGQDFDWPALSIFDEAWIQWQLRNNKFEIRCDGLDMFPTNSIQLRELLYPV